MPTPEGGRCGRVKEADLRRGEWLWASTAPSLDFLGTLPPGSIPATNEMWRHISAFGHAILEDSRTS